MSEYQKLIDKIGYHFNDESLLKMALSHRSVGKINNERLEFLGDSILGFVIAKELYERQPEASEGELSRTRALLVNGEKLAELARAMEISEFLSLGSGERRNGGRYRKSILADALEAIIGAIYLDAGMAACRHCVLRWFATSFDELSTLITRKDAKSALQEWLQARKLPLPTYSSSSRGKAHAQIFNVMCRVEGLPYATEGESTNRRKAEQIAAERYLARLENESTN